MAFMPTRLDCPLLRSLHFLQRSKHRRLSNSICLQDESPRVTQSTRYKFTTIHSRKSSDGNCINIHRTNRLANSSNRIFIRAVRSRPAEKTQTLNDSVGISFRTFALASSKEKTIVKKPINSSTSEKKHLKAVIPNQGLFLKQEGSDINLAPWQ